MDGQAQGEWRGRSGQLQVVAPRRDASSAEQQGGGEADLVQWQESGEAGSSDSGFNGEETHDRMHAVLLHAEHGGTAVIRPECTCR